MSKEIIDLKQNTLLGKKIISSINYDEQEIIRDILFLHAQGNYIDCDPTYSVGNFYKKGIRQPLYKFDIDPQVEGVIKADATNLPLKSNSVNTIMFDPPFLIGGKTYKNNKDGSSIIAKRFTAFSNFCD